MSLQPPISSQNAPRNIGGDGADDTTKISFIDVDYLSEASRPRSHGGWFLPSLGTFILFVLIGNYVSARSTGWKDVVDLSSGAMMIIVGVTMVLIMASTARRQRNERVGLESIEELVQLRRWPEAASTIVASLSQPALTESTRVQKLIFLVAVLGRYNRFDDAISLQNQLLEQVIPTGAVAHALRLGRAMAMLREDHLIDADRAIQELRRDAARAIEVHDVESAASSDTAGKSVESSKFDSSESDESAKEFTAANSEKRSENSAGLALIEMYRDVKTGHATEAIELFSRSVKTMRRQLGHRVADAHALCAKAHDFLGDNASAQSAWENATQLAPAIELLRRYPEIANLAKKYHSAPAPAEAA